MAETPPVRKFMFDKSFDVMDGGTVRAPERKPITLKPEQVDALKQEAYDAGFSAGQKAGGDEHAQHLSSLLSRIDKKIAEATDKMDDWKKQQDAQMRTMVLTIARKILPDFTEKNGLQEIQALMAGIITEMAHEPRLVVRIHDSLFDAVNAKIQEITEQKAYAGKVVVLADAEVKAGDCRIEWADGGIERNTETTWNEIEQVVAPDVAIKPSEPQIGN